MSLSDVTNLFSSSIKSRSLKSYLFNTIYTNIPVYHPPPWMRRAVEDTQPHDMSTPAVPLNTIRPGI